MLAGYVLTKAVHSFTAMFMNRPEYLQTSVSECKMQEAVYLIAYMHCALVMCAYGGERCRTLYERRRRRHAPFTGTVPTITTTTTTPMVEGVAGEPPKIIQVRSRTECVERVPGDGQVVTIGTQTGRGAHDDAKRTAANREHSCTLLMMMAVIVSVVLVLVLLVHTVRIRNPHRVSGEVEVVSAHSPCTFTADAHLAPAHVLDPSRARSNAGAVSVQHSATDVHVVRRRVHGGCALPAPQ